MSSSSSGWSSPILSRQPSTQPEHPHLVHRPEGYLALSAAGFVLKAVDVLCDPLVQCPVDGGAAVLYGEPAFYDVLCFVCNASMARSGLTA